MADGLILPGENAAAKLQIVTCASDGCASQGLARPGQDQGVVFPLPPAGWGAISALSDQGDELVLFVCSQACQRRLARKINEPRLGSLDG